MYVSIDMDQLRFLHKHPDPNAVANLVFIEAPDRHVNIVPTYCALLDVTETELQKLYRNTTDSDANCYGVALRALLIQLVDSLPATDVNLWELEMQARSIEKKNPEGLRGCVYTKGSTVMTQEGGLFQPAQLRGVLSAEAIAQSKQAQSTAPRAASEPVEPRKGSVRDVIWSVADKLWEQDGKPVDRASVLRLRKQIMDVLERDHSIKRTSSSNELGNWQRARI